MDRAVERDGKATVEILEDIKRNRRVEDLLKFIEALQEDNDEKDRRIEQLEKELEEANAGDDII